MNLDTLSVSELTEMYNARVGADKQIKKFSTKADGVRRVGELLKAEKKEAKPKTERKSGPKRIDLIIEACAKKPMTLKALADQFNTKPTVIRNDMCDIRKMLPGMKKEMVRNHKDLTYSVKDVA